MNVGQLKISILKMAPDVVHAAYNRAASNPVQSYSKSQQAEWLAQRIVEGQITLADVGAVITPATAPVFSPSPLDTPVVGQADILQVKEEMGRVRNAAVAQSEQLGNLSITLDQWKRDVQQHNAQLGQIQTSNQEALRRLDAAAQVANRAEQLALGVNGSIATIGEDLTKLGEQLAKVKAIKQEIVSTKDVEAKVAQTIADAFKPFRKMVEDAGLQASIGDAVQHVVIDRKDAKDVFGVGVNDIKGQPVLVDIWNAPNAPVADPCFIWQRDILKVMLLAQDTGANVWFGGEKGSGKSETVRNFCASTGRPFTRINFHKHSTVDDFIGSNGLDSNGTLFKPGDFLKAFTTPGAVILLDELCNAPADVLSIFNGFLEPNCAVNYGGTVWRRAAGVLIVAADNSFGSGDDTGRHAGLKTINSATIDRFSLIVPFTFLAKSVEVKALVKHTGCSEALASHVMDAITACRAKVKSGDIIDAPSIRSAVAFIRACSRIDCKDAWEMTVTQRQPAESAAAITAIYSATINPDFIRANI